MTAKIELDRNFCLNFALYEMSEGEAVFWDRYLTGMSENSGFYDGSIDGVIVETEIELYTLNASKYGLCEPKLTSDLGLVR